MKHKWKYSGLSIHNGEYWYTCEVCGDKDWIASYGTEDQLQGSKKCDPQRLIDRKEAERKYKIQELKRQLKELES